MLGLLSSHVTTGIYRRSSVQRSPTSSGRGDNNGWRAPSTTDRPKLHRRVVGIDGTLLEPGSSLAPTGFRGVKRSTWFVDSFYFGNHTSIGLTIPSYVAPPSPVKRLTQKLGYAPTVKKAQQEPPAGHKPRGSDPPSLHNKFIPDFTGGLQCGRERAAKSASEDAPDGYTNQTCL